MKQNVDLENKLTIHHHFETVDGAIERDSYTIRLGEYGALIADVSRSMLVELAHEIIKKLIK